MQIFIIYYIKEDSKTVYENPLKMIYQNKLENGVYALTAENYLE